MSQTNSDKRFFNKTIIITGAGGNFGREGCIYFAMRGANVLALDNKSETLFETVSFVQEKVEKNDQIIGLVCDVTKVESVETAVTSAIDKFGTIDLLWNNAGYQGQIKPVLDYDPADFALVMNINVTGMFIVLQAVAKRMAKTFETHNSRCAIV